MLLETGLTCTALQSPHTLDEEFLCNQNDFVFNASRRPASVDEFCYLWSLVFDVFGVLNISLKSQLPSAPD